MQALLDHAVQGTVRNAVLRVESPALGLAWAGASGLADPELGRAMRPGDAFRSASVGKMICASTVLRLAEQGALDLDTPVRRVLPEALLAGLFTVVGHDHSGEVTPRHLLGHTSGAHNYFSLPEFGALLMEEPDRLWDPREVLAFVRTTASAVFAPGQGWHYSDTGYLLLGLLIEIVTGGALHEVYRREVFAPLGMDDTYLVFREPPRPSSGAEPAHVFLGELDYTGARSLSADWAGGGLVTTTSDLTRFLRAFVDGEVLTQNDSRQAVLNFRPTGEPGVAYGLGVRHFDLGTLLAPGYGELWGHTGSSRSFMLYWPSGDLTVTGTLNQDEAPGVWSAAYPVAGLLPEVLMLLRDFSRRADL